MSSLRHLAPVPERIARANPQSVDVLDLLRKLGALLEARLVSQEEYKTERAELIARLWDW
jgi:hypothetical protein